MAPHDSLVSTRSRHQYLSWARWTHYTISLTYILSLSSHQCLPHLQSSQPKFCTYFSSQSYALEATPHSHPPWSDHPNNIWYLQIMDILIKMQFSSVSLVIRVHNKKSNQLHQTNYNTKKYKKITFSIIDNTFWWCRNYWRKLSRNNLIKSWYILQSWLPFCTEAFTEQLCCSVLYTNT